MAKRPTELPPNLEMIDVERLRPHPKNPKTHPEDQVEGLAASEKEFGFLSVLVVDEKDTILAGEGRYLMAQKQGIKQLPAFRVTGWSEEKKLAFLVADNRWAMLGPIDEAKLRPIFAELMTLKFDLAPIGYDLATVNEINARTNAGLLDPDVVPPAPKRTFIRQGDLWVLGQHRLICGDCTDPATVERLLAGDVPVLMDTDPPYGVKYDPLWREGLGRAEDGSAQRVTSGKVVNKFLANAIGQVRNDDKADWTAAWRLFPGNVCYVWHGGLHAGVVQQNLEAAGFVICGQIIWNKQNQVFSRGDYHWKHEPCWYAVRKGKTHHWTGDRKQTTVWDIQNHNPMGGNKDEEQTGHGTQKPVECMRRPILNNSRKGEFVYDPFMGSGTTIIACEMEGRRGLGCELDPVYVEMAIRRWQNFTGQVATLDGMSLDDVIKARRKGQPKGSKRASKRTKNTGQAVQQV